MWLLKGLKTIYWYVDRYSLLLLMEVIWCLGGGQRESESAPGRKETKRREEQDGGHSKTDERETADAAFLRGRVGRDA